MNEITSDTLINQLKEELKLYSDIQEESIREKKRASDLEEVKVREITKWRQAEERKLAQQKLTNEGLAHLSQDVIELIAGVRISIVSSQEFHFEMSEFGQFLLTSLEHIREAQLLILAGKSDQKVIEKLEQDREKSHKLSLQIRLKTLYNTLNDLEEKRVGYGALNVPTWINNQIQETKAEIEKIELS